MGDAGKGGKIINAYVFSIILVCGLEYSSELSFLFLSRYGQEEVIMNELEMIQRKAVFAKKSMRNE